MPAPLPVRLRAPHGTTPCHPHAPRPRAGPRSHRAALGWAVLLIVLGAAFGTRARAADAAAATLTRTGDLLVLGNGAVTAQYDLRTGLMDLSWAAAPRSAGAGPAVRRAFASATLSTAAGARTLRSPDAVRRTVQDEPVRDPLGRGLRLTVTSEFPDAAVTLSQSVTVLDNRPFVLVRVTVGRTPAAGGDAVAVTTIEALAAGGVTDPPGSVAVAGDDLRLHLTPFDNNADHAVPPAAGLQGTVSYWLTALFDASSGVGLVAGATETRVWKSAAWYDGPTASLSLFSGVRAPHDTADPPPRRADRVASAEFLVGGYRDYHDGLVDLMHAVAAREPPLPAPDLPPPLGWNPWYQYGARVDEATVRAVADVIAEQWAALGYRYVNLDAGWNVRDGDWRPNPQRFPSGMAALTDYIHARGLLAGSYFIPFAVAPELLDAPIPGTPFTFRDAVLKDANGNPIPAHILDWEYVLDGTHPAAQAHLRASAAAIAADGFDFVKLDFLHIGTQEGVHHEPTATAMEAFHRGMAAVRAGFAVAGRPIYLSAAISPLYVHQYVHARRVGTDVNFGQAREAQNIALSWFTDLLYHRNDPDNVVVREDWFPGYSDELARMHATMAALGGTLFILGDDPRYLSPERAALLTDPEVLELAKEGVAARPLELRETPPPVWAARTRDGAVVVGLFNWGDVPARRTVQFSRLGLDPARPYRVRDLWHAEAGVVTVRGAYTLELAPRSGALLRIEP